MCKKWMCLISVVLLLGVVGSASAINYFWDDGGTGQLWNVSNNWNPNGDPTSSDNAAVDLSGYTCEITSAVSAVCNSCLVGYNNCHFSN